MAVLRHPEHPRGDGGGEPHNVRDSGGLGSGPRSSLHAWKRRQARGKHTVQRMCVGRCCVRVLVNVHVYVLYVHVYVHVYVLYVGVSRREHKERAAAPATKLT